VSDKIKKRVRVVFARTVEETYEVEVEGFDFFSEDSWKRLGREEAMKRLQSGRPPDRESKPRRSRLRTEVVPDEGAGS
jgi:hypothetical protein